LLQVSATSTRRASACRVAWGGSGCQGRHAPYGGRALVCGFRPGADVASARGARRNRALAARCVPDPAGGHALSVSSIGGLRCGCPTLV